MGGPVSRKSTHRLDRRAGSDRCVAADRSQGHLRHRASGRRARQIQPARADSHPMAAGKSAVRAGKFEEVLSLIESARRRAYQAINTELVGLYWKLGEYITRKIESLERQIGSGAALRAAPRGKKVSPVVTQIHPLAADEFKDAYSLEFLGLPDDHSEADLHGALLRHLGRFIAELGRDFCFVGSEYPLQVGNQDFAIDLLFFHRGLSCLVAFELKVREFRPENLGKLSFYVEALDRDVRKSHERPSIGVLLCAAKDNEVVEYALARTTSPTFVAEYQIALPSKEILRRKLHELYAQLAP